VATKHPLHQHPSSSHINANFQNPNRGTDFYHGRGRRSRFNSRNHGSSTSVTCQVCFKPGHSVRQCYHRFDLSYQDQRHPRNQPQAMVVARYHTADNKWHPDTRATHNLTNNANNIHLLNEDDNSQDHIQVANGAVLKIIHSGTSTFSYPSKSFMLKQILCVPEIQKNLLSVHHFCLNNNVFFEFHASFFLVKDCLGNILYRGPLSNGLYNFSASLAHLQPQGLSSVHVSAKLWHRRLGHASFPSLIKLYH